MNDIEEVLNMIAEAVKEAEKQKNKAAKDEIFKRTLKELEDQIQQELDAVNEELKKEEEQKEEAPVIGPLPFHEILKCVLLNAEVTGKEMALWRESKPEEVFYISYVRGKPYNIISEDYSPMFESFDLLADDWYASEDPGED